MLLLRGGLSIYRKLSHPSGVRPISYPSFKQNNTILVQSSTSLMGSRQDKQPASLPQLLKEQEEIMLLWNVFWRGFEIQPISFYLKQCVCGHVAKAYQVFRDMRCTKSLVTFNTMIMVLGINGEGAEALKLFNQMGRFRPDHVTYLSALCACNHSGMVDDGVKLFETMTKDGSVVPNIKHYGTMVDLLGRSGRLNEAYNIINSIPITPDVLWQTLLGACKTYGNVEMAEKASRKLVEMGSHSDGEFVLLSNIYAAQRRWKDVGEEEKENALNYHSEKLAVAFGLVKIGGSIVVNKNLRICGDCHEVMKLVSRVYEREIIVRDRTRSTITSQAIYQNVNR
ncbi:hypothetical protein L1987_76424 [Smallanthus sonchifolius]|uniref:Uncharacterized protein n=1 Tax=Smallanthus sonchifolius TaxID=185202 RepID=A0ACB9A9E8_9ASTR|nr:hypothetical protein L1987_76424 [Smallanthus sonchifolius]